MKATVAMGLALLAGAGAVQAQEGLTGKYSGTFTMQTSSGERSVSLTIVIASAENGKLSGTATRLSFGGFDNCAGNYQLVGIYKDSTVLMKSVSSDRGQDCFLAFKLAADGKKLTGAAGTATISVSK